MFMKKFLWIAFCHSVSAVWQRNPIGMPIVYKSILAGVWLLSFRKIGRIISWYWKHIDSSSKLVNLCQILSWNSVRGVLSTHITMWLAANPWWNEKSGGRCLWESYSIRLLRLCPCQKDTDLDNVRDDKRFQKAMERLREVGDFGYILRKSPGYDDAASTDSLSAFTYMNPNDRDLVRVRRYFNLDSIAGAGDEISKIKICWRGYTIRFVTTVRPIIPKRKMR